MTIEEYVKQSREDHEKRFGEIGRKTDCQFYKTKPNGKPECVILTPDYSKKPSRLVCECKVCRFYCVKEAQND